ncbi:MAG: CIA30 family protein [Cyanobacteria bacterium P01_C01_bin.70]
MTQSSNNWNPLRLVDTLTFFGEIPFLGNFRWIQQMFGATSNPAAPSATDMRPAKAVVLLSGVGAEADALTDQLSQQGRIARSQILPDDSPLPEADSNRIVNAQAVIWRGVPDDEECFAAQIADLQSLPVSEDYSLFDFRQSDTADLREVWGAVDDVVMGGVSASGMTLIPGYARFAGNVSTANSGGFASVRTRNFEPPFNLQGWQGVRLVLRGDGQRYKVIMRNSNSWDSRAYCYSVDTEPDRWIVVDIPFSAFIATFRAKTQPAAPPLEANSICSFQLMLSKFEYDGDKNPHFHPGSFSLDVRSLGVYRAAPTPLLLAIADSPIQAETYGNMLSQSGLTHRILTKGLPDLAIQMAAVLPGE